MDAIAWALGGEKVALRTEGVDRNIVALMASPRLAVALRTEGVDRNDPQHLDIIRVGGRPPHGGRG